MLRLLADLAGLPPSAGGAFVSGGSAGNLSALAVARETAKRAVATGVRRTQPAARRRRLRRALVGGQHPAAARARRARRPDRRTTGSPATRCAPRSRRTATPASVAAVVATAGTTNAGIIDDLAGVAEVAREHGWWFHVDGAVRRRRACSRRRCGTSYDGIEHADSFIVDPHKWLFTPFDCCALSTGDPSLARAGAHPGRLVPRRDPRGPADGEWNPTDYAYHLTRRARGLPLWFSLAVHGDGGVRRGDRQGRDARPAHRRGDPSPAAPRADPRARPVDRAVPPGRLGARGLPPLGRRSCTRTTSRSSPRRAWEGETVGRFAFLHPHTTMDLVCEILDRTA